VVDHHGTIASAKRDSVRARLFLSVYLLYDARARIGWKRSIMLLLQIGVS